MFNDTISNENIYIEGLSREIYLSDHPSNSKIGGACLYFRNALAIKQRTDLELMQETIECELDVSRKKEFSLQSIEAQVRIVSNLKTL